MLQQRLLDRSKERVTQCCLGVVAQRKQTLKYFQPTANRLFLKITVALPTMIPGLKCALHLPVCQSVSLSYSLCWPERTGQRMAAFWTACPARHVCC